MAGCRSRPLATSSPVMPVPKLLDSKFCKLDMYMLQGPHMCAISRSFSVMIGHVLCVQRTLCQSLRMKDPIVLTTSAKLFCVAA